VVCAAALAPAAPAATVSHLEGGFPVKVGTFGGEQVVCAAPFDTIELSFVTPYTGPVLNVADLEPDRVRPLLRGEYDCLVESGAFADERIELLDGLLITTTPQDAGHVYTIERLGRALTLALADRAIVRVPQHPRGSGSARGNTITARTVLANITARTDSHTPTERVGRLLAIPHAR
jgi:hypothetical protein